MLFTGSVAFRQPLEACNKVQIPKIIQGKFKVEPDQVSNPTKPIYNSNFFIRKWE